MLPGMTAFFCPVLCRMRHILSSSDFCFQHFHHFVGGGGGGVLLEVAGNHKDSVPPAYLCQRRAVVAVLLLGVSVIGSPFCSAAF